MRRRFLKIVILLVCAVQVSAQVGIVRGNIFDKDTGEPIISATVRLAETDFGTTTNLDGFFSMGSVPVGDYRLVADLHWL